MASFNERDSLLFNKSLLILWLKPIQNDIITVRNFFALYAYCNAGCNLDIAVFVVFYISMVKKNFKSEPKVPPVHHFGNFSSLLTFLLGLLWQQSMHFVEKVSACWLRLKCIISHLSLLLPAL